MLSGTREGFFGSRGQCFNKVESEVGVKYHGSLELQEEDTKKTKSMRKVRRMQTHVYLVRASGGILGCRFAFANPCRQQNRAKCSKMSCVLVLRD